MNQQVLQVVNYRQGAYIIVEGHKQSDSFFIIMKGGVRVYESIEPIVKGTSDGELLQKGDFFGVVSCMSKRPRNETAIAATDCTLIQVRHDQFGYLIQKNTPVAMKIIRYFSNKLRTYDSALTKLTFKSSIEEDPCNLFQVGEYYYEKGNMAAAAHAYRKYLEFCPNGGFTSQAVMRLDSIDPMVAMEDVREEGFYRYYRDGQLIFSEHEPGNELFIIQQGKVKITKLVDNNEVLLAVLKEGDIFGEMAILENKPRSASAIAFGNVKVAVVKKDNFEAMVKARPEIATRIIELLSERIWIIYRQLANILLKDPIARIYDALLIQVERNRVPIREGTSYTFDFGTEELIKFLGFAPSEGKLHIRKLFETDKNIKIVDGKIHLKDMGELLKQVEFFKKRLLIELKRKLARQMG